jgi:cobyrinic acid a,c-diamide synthase
VSVLPRIVIAAPASGHGKTTVATGLMAALAARGVRVSGHKVGPDYIDPSYHSLATGRPGRNLDPFLVGADRIAPLLRHGAAGAEVAVIEGVMGLYDGRAATDEASTAHVARLLGAPVLLVVDVRGQGASVAALVRGFRDHDPRVDLAGVVLNHVGSARHELLLRDALDVIGVPVLGALHRDPALATPSRHLGLVPAAERCAEAAQMVTRLAAVVAAGVDLEAVLRVARTATSLSPAGWEPAAQVGPPVPGRPRVAIAAGAAFTFGYAETIELLTAAGVEAAPVDPLADEALPDGTRGLVIGGGFPEVYASQLSANVALREQVAALARAQRPIVAECAGLLYLAESLDDAPMCGVLPVQTRMTGRLTLGYREAEAVVASPLTPAGARVRGHEFHRTLASPGHGESPAWRVEQASGPRASRPSARADGYERGVLGGGDNRLEGFVSGSVHASYLHLHWAGQPELAARFAAAVAT